MKYTNEEFLNLLKEQRNDVEALEKYDGMNKRILFKCKKCGYEWYSTPNHIINSKRTCPNCTGTIKTNERFVKELEKLNPNIIPKEEYKKNSEKILCKCKVCGNEWKATPNNLLSRKSGCPICATKKVNENNTLTTEEFFSKAKEKKNINIEILEDEYKGYKHKLNVQCNICGYKWEILPSNILNGNGCPNCRISKLENGIKNILNELKTNYIWQVKKDKFKWLKKQSLDFFLPEQNIIIECQGEQHFNPIKHFGGTNRFIDTIERDRRKNNLIKENGFKIVYVVDKCFKKFINSNMILEEIYKNDEIIWVETDNYGNVTKNGKKILLEKFLTLLEYEEGKRKE